MSKRTLLLVSLLGAILPTHLSARGNSESTKLIDSQFEGLTAVQRNGGWDRGTPGGEFTVGVVTADPDSFNPAVAESASAADLMDLLFATPFRRNQFTLEWEPYLADSYAVSEDGLTITVTLKPDLSWSDGTPLTAEDVVFSAEEIHLWAVETGSRYGARLFIEGEPTEWEVVDERTFRVACPAVYRDPIHLVNLPVLPKHVVEPVVAENGRAGFARLWSADTDPTQIVGNGPFIVESYEPGSRVVLTRNSSYHGVDEKGGRLPYLERIVYLFVDTRERLKELFLDGTVDFYEVPGDEFYELSDLAVERDFVLYEAGPDDTIELFAINMNPIDDEGDAGLGPPQIDWLQQKEFRLALAHSIDRSAMIEEHIYGLAYPVYSFVPAYSPYYWQGQEEATPKHDPERAQQLLDQLGYRDNDGDGIREDADGNRISLSIRTNEDNEVRQALIESFAASAAEIGIEITTETVEYGELVDDLLETFEWELASIGLLGSIDPGMSDLIVPSSGELHLHEPRQEAPRRSWEQKLDMLWTEHRSATDSTERRNLLEQVQQTWIEEVPALYLLSTVTIHGFGAGWGNVYPQAPDGYGWESLAERLYRIDG